MEVTLVPLAYNLDKVLNRLESVYKERKLRKKDMEKIFDSIVQDDDGRWTSIGKVYIFVGQLLVSSC